MFSKNETCMTQLWLLFSIPVDRSGASAPSLMNWRNSSLFLPDRWPMGIPWLTRPGKHTKNDGKSPFLMGKSTISMTIFNSFLYVYQRVRNSQFTEFGNRPRKSGRPTKSGRYWQYRLGIELRRRHVRNVPKFGGTQKFLHSHRIHVCYIW